MTHVGYLFGRAERINWPLIRALSSLLPPCSAWLPTSRGSLSPQACPESTTPHARAGGRGGAPDATRTWTSLLTNPTYSGNASADNPRPSRFSRDAAGRYGTLRESAESRERRAITGKTASLLAKSRPTAIRRAGVQIPSGTPIPRGGFRRSLQPFSAQAEEQAKPAAVTAAWERPLRVCGAIRGSQRWR
jgi:hypothetical protein